MPVTLPQIKSLFMYRTVGTEVLRLLVHLHLVVICLFVCSQWLVAAGNYYYYCLPDNQQWTFTKVEEAGGLILCQFIGKNVLLLAKMCDCLGHNIIMYV